MLYGDEHSLSAEIRRDKFLAQGQNQDRCGPLTTRKGATVYKVISKKRERFEEIALSTSSLFVGSLKKNIHHLGEF